jgi:hypothetical protein
VTVLYSTVQCSTVQYCHAASKGTTSSVATTSIVAIHSKLNYNKHKKKKKKPEPK